MVGKQHRRGQHLMAMSKEDAVKKARADAARRLGVPENEIKEESIEQADFPDMALGAPAKDEMSGMMISTGWRIRLSGGGRKLEYRADDNQLRLYNFNGANHRI
ncbi:MAG: hypothetical protein H0W76_09260 [Pyrinomonadaceae bacterium]|nr:hypothetical protein [Pyrinomonadaceae bacterium]